MPGETSLEKAWFKQGDEGKIGEKLHIEEPSETNETTEEETDEKKQPEEEKAA